MMSTFFRPRFITLIALVALCAGVVVASAMTGASAPNINSIDLEADDSQYLSVLDAAQIALDITADLTIEAWVKIERPPGVGENYAIVSKWGDANSRSYWFAYGNRDGVDMLDLYLSPDGVAVTEAAVHATLATGQWHHVAVTKSGTTVKFYVNGSQQGTDQSGSTAVVFDSAADFGVGAQIATAPGDFFDGIIDDVRIWRIARTAADIAADQSRELNGNELGLVAYWQLDGSLSDATQNANTLMNNGAAIFSADTPPLQ